MATPEEYLEALEKGMRKSRKGPKAAADAMAAYLAWRVAEITLRRTMHAPGEWHRARPGEPPAYASGTLARATYFKSASEGLRTSALVGNKAMYSRILEFGCTVFPVYGAYMSWTDTGGTWYHKLLDVPEHPYMQPTVEEAISDGSLLEAAIDGFRPFDP